MIDVPQRDWFPAPRLADEQDEAAEMQVQEDKLSALWAFS